MKNEINEKQERRIEIDIKQFKGVMLLSLFVFNAILLSAIITLLCCWNRWFVWLVCIVVGCYCIGSSFYTYFKSRKRLSYNLTENSLTILSTLIDVSIPYEEISKIIVKTSLNDRLFKRKEQTLVLHTKGKEKSKYAIYFIKEDANALAKELLELAKKSKQKI